jgi:REP element-mobilizing transposase RayT
MTLGDVMHRFKTLTTKLYSDGVREAQWPPFRRRLWQRDYYEHVIRDAGALHRIRTYIEQNPLRWRTDAQNPRRGAPIDSR